MVKKLLLLAMPLQSLLVRKISAELRRSADIGVQEEQLKQIMIYAGRPGLWGDWQKFQAKARVARREAEIAAARKRKKIVEGTLIGLFIVLCLSILGSIVALILHHQGRL